MTIDRATDDGVVYIGVAHTPFASAAECPRSLTQARALGGTATLDFGPEFVPGLLGIDAASHLIVLTWMDQAERDVLIQFPHGRTGAHGVFSIRSPARPNPIGLHVVRLLSADLDRGLLITEALDCRDGTPIIDVKPFRPDVDIPPA